MDWLDSSIMTRRGWAGGETGATHHLTEEVQGEFHFTIGPYSDPVLHIAPGDRVIVDTMDAFGGAVQTEDDLPSAKLTMPYVNPQNGPIMVEGAEIGDALAVYIETMDPFGDEPKGACAMIPEFGALTGTALTATLNEPLPEKVRVVPLDTESVYWSDRVTLPYRPHIGTLSTSPTLDSINSLHPGQPRRQHGPTRHGPRLDHLPPGPLAGGRLFIGDAHACQGDGEVCGTAIEYRSVTTIRVDLIKGWTIDWPRLENDEVIMAIGSARPLEDAARIAYRELIRWMVADHDYDQWDAYMMLSQCGRVRLGNFVDPNYTVGCGGGEALSLRPPARLSDEHTGAGTTMDLQLKGKRALVTGGTKGIGRAIADTLADEGADVAICARNGDEVDAAVSALGAKGVNATGSAVDVGDAEALRRAGSTPQPEALGGIDIVVSNVSALAIGADEESWKQSFNVDVMGAVRLIEAAMPHLEASDAASIITISSVSGREIDFAAGPYGTMKAALIHYTQGMANQLAAKGIRANSVSPGNTYFEGGVWNQIETGDPELYETALGLNPTGRMGTPEEMANAVAFLASPRASFITGSNLVVDGALTRGVQL